MTKTLTKTGNRIRSSGVAGQTSSYRHRFSRQRSFWAAAAALLLIPGFAEAHYVSKSGIGTAIQVIVEEDRIRLTVDIGYGTVYARGEMMSMDADEDFYVSEDEAESYRGEAWEKHVAGAITVKFNGIDAPVRFVSSRSDTLVGDIGLVPFDLFFVLEAEIPYASPEERAKNVTVEIINRVLEKDVTMPPVYFIPLVGHGKSCSFKILEPQNVLTEIPNHIAHGKRIAILFEHSGGDVPRETAKLTPGGVAIEPSSGDDEPEAREPDGDLTRAEEYLLDVLKQKDPAPLVIALAILIAFLAGAAHALEPGHGKAMVAAYLVGSRGRIRDAVLLGLTVTFTHTFSIFLLGGVLYFVGDLKEPTTQARYNATCKLLAAAMLLGMGVWLFVRRCSWIGHPERLREAGHSHSHEHSHGHSHSHGHEDDRAGGDDHGHSHEHEEIAQPTTSLWQSLYFGVIGGMVPCYGGFLVLMIGLRYPDRFGYVLGLLLVYSIGLGTVLVSVGALFVSGQHLLLKRSPRRDLILASLPAVSALFIAALGAYFLTASLLEDRHHLGAILSVLGEWLGS